MRRLLIGFAVAGLIGLVLVQAALWYGRSIFAEPDVEVAQSVTEALNAERIVLVFAHPDDEITATELISRAVAEGAFVATVTATRGEAGTQFRQSWRRNIWAWCERANCVGTVLRWGWMSKWCWACLMAVCRRR